MLFTFKQVIAAATLTALSSMALASEHIVEMKNAGADGATMFEPGYVKAEPGDMKFLRKQ